jgi:hypothetical protein
LRDWFWGVVILLVVFLAYAYKQNETINSLKKKVDTYSAIIDEMKETDRDKEKMLKEQEMELKSMHKNFNCNELSRKIDDLNKELSTNKNRETVINRIPASNLSQALISEAREIKAKIDSINSKIRSINDESEKIACRNDGLGR